MTMKLSRKIAVAFGLLAALQLTSLSASAKSVGQYIDEDDLDVTNAYKNAAADCNGDKACEDQIPRDLLSRGVTATEIMIAAVANGADPAYVVKVFTTAAMNADIELDRITKALTSITKVQGSGFSESDVVSGMVQAAEEQNSSKYTTAAVVASAKSASITASSVISGLTSANMSEDDAETLAEASGYSEDEVQGGVDELADTSSDNLGESEGDIVTTTEALDEISDEIVTGGNSLAGVTEA